MKCNRTPSLLGYCKMKSDCLTVQTLGEKSRDVFQRGCGDIAIQRTLQLCVKQFEIAENTRIKPKLIFYLPNLKCIFWCISLCPSYLYYCQLFKLQVVVYTLDLEVDVNTGSVHLRGLLEKFKMFCTCILTLDKRHQGFLFVILKIVLKVVLEIFGGGNYI